MIGAIMQRHDDISVIDIKGMTCGHCVRAVTCALGQVDGVSVRSVVIGRAEIAVRDPEATARALAAIEDMGYSAHATAAPPSADGATAVPDRERMEHE